MWASLWLTLIKQIMGSYYIGSHLVVFGSLPKVILADFNYGLSRVMSHIISYPRPSHNSA